MLNDRKIFRSSNGELVYYSAGTGSRVIVILPPGTGSVEYVRPLVSNLGTGYKVIVVETPGVSGNIVGQASFENIASLVGGLVKYLQLENINLIGVSYGGVLALKLTQQFPVSKLVLVTVGDFFSQPTRFLLRGLFWWPKNIKFFRKVFGLVIQHGKILDLRVGPDINFDILMDRFWELLWFRLEEKVAIDKALVIMAKRDKILTSGARKKMEKIVLKPTFIEINSGHLDACEKLTNNEYKRIRKYFS